MFFNKKYFNIINNCINNIIKSKSNLTNIIIEIQKSIFSLLNINIKYNKFKKFYCINILQC